MRTVSVRLLEFHARYAELFADALCLKAVGDDEGAMKLCDKMCEECGKREIEFERWYDHGMFFEFIYGIFKSRPVMKLDEIDLV